MESGSFLVVYCTYESCFFSPCFGDGVVVIVMFALVALFFVICLLSRYCCDTVDDAR